MRDKTFYKQQTRLLVLRLYSMAKAKEEARTAGAPSSWSGDPSIHVALIGTQNRRRSLYWYPVEFIMTDKSVSFAFPHERKTGVGL